MAKRQVSLPREERRPETPVERYNRLLGDRAGTSQQVRRPSPAATRSDSTALARRIASRSQSVPSNLRGPRRDNFNIAASDNPAQAVANSAVDRLLEQFSENQAEQAAINAAHEEERQNHDDPWYMDAARFITGAQDGTVFGGDSPIERVMDIASRPSYGLFEGLRAAAGNQDYSGSNTGLGSLFEDFVPGFVRGFTGQDKTGFGQVYEEYKENPVMYGSDMLQRFEENNPTLESWFSRGVGLAGELGLDPLNMVVPAAPKVLRATDELLSERTLSEALQSATSRAVDDFTSNSTYFHGNPQAFSDRVATSVEDLMAESALHVQAGGRAGTHLMNDATWPGTVGNRVVEEMRDELTRSATDTLEQIIQGNVNRYDMDDFFLRDPNGQEIYNNLSADLVQNQILPANHTPDELYDLIDNGSLTPSFLRQVRDTTYSRFDSDLQKVYDGVVTNTLDPTYRTLGVRFMGEEIPIKFLGRAYDKSPIGRRAATGRRAAILDSVSYERNMPGVIGARAARARAVAFKEAEAFEKEVRQMARHFSMEQTEELQRLLASGARSSNVDMNKALDFLRTKYDEIFTHEQTGGGRSSVANSLGSRHGDDYNYMYYHGRDQQKIADFKGRRKAEYNSTGREGRFNLNEAIHEGLKPERNAFMNLMMRHKKMMRDMTKANFLQDLIDNYGVLGDTPTAKLSKFAQDKRKLKRVSPSKLKSATRQMTEKMAGDIYLPTGIHDTYEFFSKAMSWSPQQFGSFLRTLSNVTNKIKLGLTLPNMGFHMRNFTGDLAMGLLDDVSPRTYTEFLRKYLLNKGGKTQYFKITDNWSMSFDELVQLYRENADAGFVNIDLDSMYNSYTAGRIGRRISTGSYNALRKGSDMREEFGRVVHFLSAMRDEAKALTNKGKLRSIKDIKRRATDAALWRVNQYKFDYNALTIPERKFKAVAFPFYTYMRKALPLLLEQMFMNPKYFAAANRFMEYNDGSGADSFNSMNIPEYIRSMGFGVLSDEKEPWAVTSDVLPLGVMDILNSQTAPEFSRNLLGNLNPFAQAPIELATNRDLFTNRPLNQSIWQYMLANTPMLPDLQSELGVNVPGLQGEPGSDFGEYLSNRIAGLGLPVRRITWEQQLQQQNQNMDDFIEDPLQDFNYSQDVYTISRIEGNQYRIRNKHTGETVGIAPTPQLAISYAENLPNQEIPRTNPYSPSGA